MKQLGSRRFTYAAITDTHLNQGEDECNSPYAVNRLANARLRHVVRELNSMDLAFVVNIGDLIHPVPAIPDLYRRAAHCFLQQIGQLRHPIYLTPGNHDIGDKPNPWAPAASVCDEYVALWEEHFGPHYQSFDHDSVHFVIVNAQIINSGLAAEANQQAWLEADLERHRGQRIFLHIHYPPFFTRPDEEVNYDNLAEPGRGWLLGLMERYGVEVMLAGHVHNFWYNRYAQTDCYLVPSTAFVRQDYSEMYRSPPGDEDEDGRNDRPKLAYFLVHVHEQGHVVEIMRTFGRVLESAALDEADSPRIPAAHPLTNPHFRFGFDMRHNWAEIVEIPPTGGLDEFDRKEVRNDYPLMALWELGVRRLRVPLRDLLHQPTRDRMRELRAFGQEFVLFTFGAPTDRDRTMIDRHHDLFSAWEICIDWGARDLNVTDIRQAASEIPLDIYLSRLRSISELRAEAGHYYHVINQGFLPDDTEQLRWLKEGLGDDVAGFVFRVTAEVWPWDAIEAASRIAAGLGAMASVHIRLCGSNPAAPIRNDHWAANRVAEAMFAANAFDNTWAFADTFVDIDRGYFVRHGVLDRLCNPRPAFHLLRALSGQLCKYPEFRPSGSHHLPGCRALIVNANDKKLALLLGEPGVDCLAAATNSGLFPDKPQWQVSLPMAPTLPDDPVGLPLLAGF